MKHPLTIGAALAAGLLFAGAALAQPNGGGGPVMQACAADFHKYCPDAKPGPGGGLRACVVTHLSTFSDECKAAIAQMEASNPQNRSPTPNGTAAPGGTGAMASHPSSQQK